MRMLKNEHFEPSSSEDGIDTSQLVSELRRVIDGLPWLKEVCRISSAILLDAELQLSSGGVFYRYNIRVGRLL